MNIRDAKVEIRRTLRAYTDQTEDGIYRIPRTQQRPILLIGPPGIGKTAIMNQIAQEESVGLVSYTMTHHTRQSAIGLPTVKERIYHHKPCTVTEYTMSEIVASVYDCMERTGYQTGILFIDEMNCVSETLAPVMLQLLQSKTFGSHRIPDGWLIVAAGNPPEYNKSVREFDMVTLDRVRHMEIEADLSVWKEYACQHQVHPAILAFLNLYPDCFYIIETNETAPAFVTARGWEDLSSLLLAYERNGESITEELMLQYLQHDDTARNFYLFYDLFCHYVSDFAAEDYFSPGTLKRIQHADPTELIAVASMLFSRIRHDAGQYALEERQIKRQAEMAETFFHTAEIQPSDSVSDLLQQFLTDQRTACRIKEEHNLLPFDEKVLQLRTFRRLDTLINTARKERCRSLTCFKQILTDDLEIQQKEHQNKARQISRRIRQSYELLESSPAAICLSYFTSDLACSRDCSNFLLQYPCEAFLRHTESLALNRREKRLRQELSRARSETHR